jgi:hypothetical protein
MPCHLFQLRGGGPPPRALLTVDLGCDGFVKLDVLTGLR